VAQAESLHDTTTLPARIVEAAMPLTAAALSKGEVGPGHVEVIQKTLGGMRHLDPQQRAWAEELLVIQAAETIPPLSPRHATRIRDIVDPDGPPPSDDDSARPNVSCGAISAATVRWSSKGRLDPRPQLCLRRCEAVRQVRQRNPRHRGMRAGWHAFRGRAEVGRQLPRLPTHNGVRTEVAFTISLDALERATDDTIRRGHTSYLTAREAPPNRLRLSAFRRRHERDIATMDVAVPAYVVPAPIRRALVLRDRGCVFPSCDRPASVCDAHHIQEHLKGGRPDFTNLILVCATIIAYFTGAMAVDTGQRPAWFYPTGVHRSSPSARRTNYSDNERPWSRFSRLCRGVLVYQCAVGRQGHRPTAKLKTRTPGSVQVVADVADEIDEHARETNRHSPERHSKPSWYLPLAMVWQGRSGMLAARSKSGRWLFRR